MARYSYVAIDLEGREKRGGIDARDERAVHAALAGRKLYPLEVAPMGATPVSAQQKSTPSRVRGSLSHKARLLVTRQLATLIGASVSVDEALGMLAAQQEDSAARRILADLRSAIQEGMRLADAMARHKSSFPGAYRAAIAGGERSGNLAPVLTRLADYLQREHALRSKIATAMIYPAALMAVAAAVIGCLMIFVVPALVDQFKAFHGELPLVTQILIGVSEGLARFWPVLLIAIVGGFIAARTALRQPHIRLGFDSALMRLPMLGKWIRAVSTSRFVRSISMLASSGLPILESVRASRDAASNRAFARAIDAMGDRIQEGEPLSGAMRKSALIPPVVVYMAVGGENSGELPDMLQRAANHLDEEFEGFVQAALSLIEPLIIVLMGAIVASIVLAIMLPILQLNQLAAG